MKHKLTLYMPVGFRSKDEINAILFVMTGATIGSLRFLLDYKNDYYRVVERMNLTSFHESLMMSSFVSLYGHSMMGFLLVAAAMPLLMLLHYLYHFQGSKSIYLMKRLPDRLELLRRCCLVPVCAMAACLLLCLLLTFTYYAVYMLVTPDEVLPPDAGTQLLLLLERLLPFLRVT